jgi:hypothetical protein
MRPELAPGVITGYVYTITMAEETKHGNQCNDGLVYAKRRFTARQKSGRYTTSVRTHLSIIREAAAVVIGCFEFISGHVTSSLTIILNIWTHTNTAYGIITGVREVCSLPSVNTTVSKVHHPESVQLLPAHPAMHFKIRTASLSDNMRPCPIKHYYSHTGQCCDSTPRTDCCFSPP